MSFMGALLLLLQLGDLPPGVGPIPDAPAPLVEPAPEPGPGQPEAAWRLESYVSFAEAAAAAPPDGELVDLGDKGWGYIPRSAAGHAAPALLLLHGLGQDNRRFLEAVRPVADGWGFVVIAPHARRETWDLLAGRPSTLGPMAKALRDRNRPDRDAPRVRAAILAMAQRTPVDARRIAVAGFSDGASYALTLGTGAPQLFDHIIVLSGGMAMMDKAAAGEGRKVFLAHGTSDAMLKYAHARYEMTEKLREAGFDVAFRSFDGPHVLYYRVFIEAIEDWLGSGRLVRHAPGAE